MTRANNAALVDEALEFAAKVEETGGDEFAQWLAAFLHVSRPRTEFTEDEIYAAWEHFQDFKKTLKKP